jgi:hypothetical protein
VGGIELVGVADAGEGHGSGGGGRRKREGDRMGGQELTPCGRFQR